MWLLVGIPDGASSGFLGFSVKDVYNVVPNYLHGTALIRRLDSIQLWRCPRKINTSFFQANCCESCIMIRKGELLQFMVNDNEWQNNSGHFEVQLEYCDTCKAINKEI
jgi:hypothetical protein